MIRAPLVNCLLVFCSLYTIASFAAATTLYAQEPARFAFVKGWQRGIDPAKVTVYDREGNELPARDLRGVPVRGRHAYLADYDIVQIAPDAWVEAIRLDVEFCPQKAKDSDLAGGKHVPDVAAGWGSGNGC